MRWFWSLSVFGMLLGCGVKPEDDTIYQTLLTNAPTEVPAEYVERLRAGRFVCDVFNEGQSDQYMTCWFPGGLPSSGAYLSYFASNPLRPPEPENIVARGGEPITDYILFP